MVENNSGGQDGPQVQGRQELASPLYSYEINGAGVIRELIAQGIDGNSYASFQISSDTSGIIGPLLVRYGERHYDYTRYAFSLVAQLKIPSTDTVGFIDKPNWPNFLNINGDKARGLQLQRNIQSYVDKELAFDKEYSGSTNGKFRLYMSRVRNGRIVSKDLISFKNDLNIPEVIYDLKPLHQIIKGSSSTHDRIFRREMETFLKILVIYSTMLNQFAHLDEDPSRIVIDPKYFKVLSQELSTERKLELMRNPDFAARARSDSAWSGRGIKAILEEAFEREQGPNTSDVVDVLLRKESPIDEKPER